MSTADAGSGLSIATTSEAPRILTMRNDESAEALVIDAGADHDRRPFHHLAITKKHLHGLIAKYWHAQGPSRLNEYEPLAKLSPEARACAVLRYFTQEDPATIARQLTRPESEITRHLDAARPGLSTAAGLTPPGKPRPSLPLYTSAPLSPP